MRISCCARCVTVRFGGFPVVFSLRWVACLVAAAAGLLASATGPAGADTLKWALTQAYQNNPQLNSQRASVRATDETVPQALSGYRPRITLTATAGGICRGRLLRQRAVRNAQHRQTLPCDSDVLAALHVKTSSAPDTSGGHHRCWCAQTRAGTVSVRRYPDRYSRHSVRPLTASDG